jgi:hypothetical protein
LILMLSLNSRKLMNCKPQVIVILKNSFKDKWIKTHQIRDQENKIWLVEALYHQCVSKEELPLQIKISKEDHLQPMEDELQF